MTARVRLAVGLGGAVGSVARVAVDATMTPTLADVGAPVAGGLPWATLLVNLTGAFALAALGGLLVGPALRAGVLVGAIGAWTTVSTLAVEVVDRALLGGRGAAIAAGYLVVTIAGGMLAVRLGERLRTGTAGPA